MAFGCRDDKQDFKVTWASLLQLVSLYIQLMSINTPKSKYCIMKCINWVVTSCKDRQIQLYAIIHRHIIQVNGC